MDESVLFKMLFKTFWKSKNDFFHRNPQSVSLHQVDSNLKQVKPSPLHDVCGRLLSSLYGL